MLLVVMGGQPRLDIRQMGRSHLSPFSLDRNTWKKKKKSKINTFENIVLNRIGAMDMGGHHEHVEAGSCHQ